MKLLIFAALVVSASAFMNMGAPAQQQQRPMNNQISPKQMPDMNLVMQMVRQIVSLLMPKFMANPALYRQFIGGKGRQPARGAVNPLEFVGGASGNANANANATASKPMAPMPAAPPPGGMGMAMGMNPPPNIFHPQPAAPAPGAYAAGAPGGFMPTGDAFKDMQIADLLRDPELGFTADPQVSAMIPPPGSAFGLNLHDRMKDYIQYNLMRRRGPNRPLTAKENNLLHLIGDPPKEFMMGGFGGAHVGK